ncbi:MAG: alpha/beta hydrolase [Bacteroidetes bacterium]|jgi:pimeloyl-ACP methyl ester carboxylesterase|nr:alpha/beta hydrolase [Bacteroidota bacterium]
MKKMILTTTLIAGGLGAAWAQPHPQGQAQANKPVILIIHGFPGNASDWEETAAALSTHYRVLLPDLAGFGKQEARGLSFEQLWVDSQAQKLKNLLEQEQVENLYVLAHDYGVPVAISLRALIPNRIQKMVLTAGNLLSAPPLNLMMKATSKPLVGGPARALLFSAFSNNAMRKMGTRKGKHYPVKNTALERQAIKTIFGTALGDMKGYFMPIEQQARKTDIPVLLIWGEKDPFFPIEHTQRMQAALPQADLTTYAGVGHYCYLEEKTKFTEDVLNFFSK